MRIDVKKAIIIIIVSLLLFTMFFYRTRLYKVDWQREKSQDYEIEKELGELEEVDYIDNIIDEDESSYNGDNNEIEEEIKNNNAYYREASSFTEKIPGQVVDCLYKKDGVPSPKGIAFTPDGKEYWITSLMNKSRGVIVFESETGSRKKDIILPNGGGVEIIFNKDGSRAYVSQMETGRVYEIDTVSKEITRTLETRSTWTKVMALSGDESTLYASNWSSNNISAISLETGDFLYHIKSVATPRGLYATKDGKYIYIAGFKNGEIQKVNLHTKESSVIYRNEGAMRHIVADEGKGVLYISDMANAKIYRVYLKDDKVEEFVKTERNPNTIALSEDKKILIVSNRGVNNKESYHLPGPEWGTVMFFDTSTGNILDVVIGGNQPTGLDVYRNRVVYSNFLDGSVVFCLMPSYRDFLDKDGGSKDNFKDHIVK